jgi:Forkhead domain
MGPSSSLYDHRNPMELQQYDSCSREPFSLGESLIYVDTELQSYNTLQRLSDQEAITRSARIPPHAYENSANAPDLGLSTDLLSNNGFGNAWHYHEALEAQEHRFGSDLHPTPCLNKEFGYPTHSTLNGPYKTYDSSDAEAYKEDMTSSCTSPNIDSLPLMEVWPAASDEPNPALHLDIGLLARDRQDEEEGSGDKPYARLIHEALMQAPGHRMMLREIYDWFVQNTSKPSESGTNGWQNSIRHNLSMNQVSVCKAIMVSKVEAS